jgi:2'-5' RNA ligase
VAVWPTDDVLDRVAALDRPPVPGLRWTTRDQWHVTLRFLGTVPEVRAAVEAMAELSVFPAVEAVVGPAAGRFGQRVLHLPVAGLEALADGAVLATAAVGRPPEDRPFTGHLTLARAAKGTRVDLRPLTGMELIARWTVQEICLVESRLSSSGARYQVVERVRLGSPPNR